MKLYPYSVLGMSKVLRFHMGTNKKVLNTPVPQQQLIAERNAQKFGTSETTAKRYGVDLNL